MSNVFDLGNPGLRIRGYSGADIPVAPGTDARTVLPDSAILNVKANQANPDTLVEGGVAEFEIANPTIALKGSDTAHAPYINVLVSTTGFSNIRFRANVRDLSTVNDAVQQVAVQYRTDETPGTPFIDVPEAYIADATQGGTATLVTAIDLILPAATNNVADLEIRVMTVNAVGDDEWIGIDDISVTGMTGGPTPTPTPTPNPTPIPTPTPTPTPVATPTPTPTPTPVATPTPTPTSTPTPTPGGGTCTPSTTVSEGDLFPGGIPSFGVSSGPGSVTVDHVNAGSGLQSLTVVPGSVVNAVVNIPAFAPGTTAPVVVTFTAINPALPVDFTLRAGSQFHAAFIRVRCGTVTPTTNTFSGQATGIQANVTIPPAATVTTVVAQTDPLPPGGGAGNSGPGMMFIRQVEQGSVILGGVGTLNTLQTGAISAFTAGGPAANRPDSSQSRATVANLDASILGNSIGATLVQAESVCACSIPTPICSPRTMIGGLVINGTAINLSTTSVVNLRVGGLSTGDIIGQVFINQSTTTGTGQMRANTINALRINFTAGELAGTNIIIAQAYSDINCG
ncbi:MAG: hypothetical protein H0X72_14395 [Acidobacteria bacterium]|jgi:hypothetical protein|nr:hypothetical protein [Acidobacteriota bacterium]